MDLSQEITKHLLAQASTPHCKLRGIFRAHQHNASTMVRILNHDHQSDPEDAGVAKLWLPSHTKQPAYTLWDGIVCTFCVSPHNGYGKAFNYNFDAFGILKTGVTFTDWQLVMQRLPVSTAPTTQGQYLTNLSRIFYEYIP